LLLVVWLLLLGWTSAKGGDPAGLTYLSANDKGFNEYRNEKDGSVLIHVPAGEFIMGSPKGEGDPDEKPQHKVLLGDYYIGKYEVTNEQFVRFVSDTGYQAKGYWKEYAVPGKEKHPVVAVSWDDAAKYCEWAGLRLPTEAEWEKAARGADGRKWPWGSEWDENRLNSREKGRSDVLAARKAAGNPPTVPVGMIPEGASPFGALDMAGNAYEWCADWYEETYYRTSPAENPTGPSSGSVKVMRGGSWRSVPRECPTAGRRSNVPTFFDTRVGFRVAKSP
jgi:formylglycine-generating enzyme required for sulfatase activity